jgi:predicted Mrr-cat superfamily restriction endonuclease
VTSAYKYETADGVTRNIRAVEWVRPDVASSVFGQDLLQSFGACITVCIIALNGAEQRVAAVLAGTPDPGCVPTLGKNPKPETFAVDNEDASLDLGQAAHDQMVAHIQSRSTVRGIPLGSAHL